MADKPAGLISFKFHAAHSWGMFAIKFIVLSGDIYKSVAVNPCRPFPAVNDDNIASNIARGIAHVYGLTFLINECMHSGS